MKHQVIKPFIDSKTLRGFNVGDTYESKDSERVALLIGQGFISAEIEVQELDYIELKKQAKELKISGYNKMSKNDLANAILEAQNGQSITED